MSITAEYEFDRKSMESMPVTIKFTAPLHAWRQLNAQLRQLEMDPSAPVSHCIANIIGAIETAMGHSYRTRGYSFEVPQPEMKAAE